MIRSLVPLAAAAVLSTGLPSHAEIRTLSPQEAQALSASGDILLIDVRTLPEWRMTGVAVGARLIPLQDQAFLDEVERLQSNDPYRSVAFICRTGARSQVAAERLDALVPDAVVYNVVEGMVGAKEGEGWIARGLPVASWTEVADCQTGAEKAC